MRFNQHRSRVIAACAVAALVLSGCQQPQESAHESADEQYHMEQNRGSDGKYRSSARMSSASAHTGFAENHNVNLESRRLQPQGRVSGPVVEQARGSQRIYAPIYWVADTPLGLRLFREFLQVPDEGDPIVTAVKAMFNSRPLDPDFSHHLPAVDIVGVSLSTDNLITLDFPASAFNRRYTPELAELIVQQIVYTATAAAAQASLGEPGREYRVKILVDGESRQRVFDSLDLADEYYRDVNVLAPVWIIDPQQSSVVGEKVEIKGLCTTDAEEVDWVIYRREGKDWRSYRQGRAKLATGDSPFSQMYTIQESLPISEYRIEVKESAHNGIDSKEFRVD